MLRRLLQPLRNRLFKRDHFIVPDDVNPLEVFRGYFDQVHLEGELIIVQGWMVNWQSAYDEIYYSINDEKLGVADVIERPDVAQRLPHIRKSLQSGFRFMIPKNQVPGDEIFTIRVVGNCEGVEGGSIETAYVLDIFDKLPTPPVNLIQRVDELSSSEFYLIKGVQNFNEFWRLIQQQIDPKAIRSLLDWGCGSGRLTGFFIEYTDIPQIQGCDIDADAIQWANENLSQAKFSVIPPYPPTTYGDAQFDVVVSFSVLTHLTEDNQRLWMEEMHRMMKPGGLMLATIHGMTAARTILASEQITQLTQDGIFDHGHDARLDGVAPEQYYRATFQTKAYIQSQWQDLFAVIDHVEHGASNYHDIVVLKKK